MPKKKPTRKTRKKPARASKPPRSKSSKKRTRRKPAARKRRTGKAVMVEILEIATIGGDVSDADEAEVPSQEPLENGFPPEFGGEE